MNFTDCSIHQVCRMFGEKREAYVRDAVRAKKLPGYKQLGQWYIREKDLSKIKKFIMNKKREIMHW